MTRPAKALSTRTPSPSEQARIYRDAGLRVMPIAMPTKTPAVPKGFYGRAYPDATSEPDDFRASHQVGVLCGRVEGRDDVTLLGLDDDGFEGWAPLEQALGFDLPPTLSSKGDRHRYYWLPADHGLQQRNGVVPKIDVRPHAGGYFREPWEWDDGFDVDAIAELSPEVVEALRALIGTAADDGAGVDDGRECAFSGWGWAPDISAIADLVAPAGVDGEGRHETVRMLAGYLARRGYAPDEVAEAVRLQFPSDKPGERAAQAREAARRVRFGLSVPGWTALVERFGEDAVRELEATVRDPREPDGWTSEDGHVWSEWWAEAFGPDGWCTRMAARPLAANDVHAHASLDGTGLRLTGSGVPHILQHRTSYWLHGVETYGSDVSTAELVASVARDLHGLIDEDDLNRAELDKHWVKVLSRVRSSYTARSNSYDPATNELTLAALRWAALPAKRHAHIDQWLRALFGSGYNAAAQWLASLIDLDRPAPCLYLPGPPGIGKSLLASGLARLWGLPDPADMAEAISDFNENTGECPLVFGDEGLPQGLDFKVFRDMITKHSRRVNLKYKNKVTVEGCARFIVCANNEDVLRYQKTGTLTKDDLDAIAERLLVITCNKAAREAVSKLDTKAAAEHEIAEHVLWLAQTVALQPKDERMAAKHGGGERILANVVAGRNTEILVKIREALTIGGELGARSGVYAPSDARGEVRVNVTKLSESMFSRVALSDIKELCDGLRLRPGAEQHKAPGKPGQPGQNVRWRILDRAKLDEAFAGLD